jgi:hypothetical protein
MYSCIIVTNELIANATHQYTNTSCTFMIDEYWHKGKRNGLNRITAYMFTYMFFNFTTWLTIKIQLLHIVILYSKPADSHHQSLLTSSLLMSNISPILLDFPLCQYSSIIKVHDVFVYWCVALAISSFVTIIQLYIVQWIVNHFLFIELWNNWQILHLWRLIF